MSCSMTQCSDAGEAPIPNPLINIKTAFWIAKSNVFDYQNLDHRMQIGDLNVKAGHKTQDLPPEGCCLLKLPI